MIGIGIGINYSRVFGSLDSQAQAHYDRVIADGGAIPAGLIGCSNFFVAVKAVYSTSDITTAISAGYDPHYLGYKLGAGSGTTLGQAAQKLYSCCGASGDVTQTTAASQPLLLVHDGSTNYYFGSGVSGNYCSTPNAVANQVTGDIEIEAQISGMKSGVSNTIVGKSYLVQQYIFMVETTGALRAFFGTKGNATSSVVLPYSSTDVFWVKVTRTTSDGVVKFYHSTDGTTYTQLGIDKSTTSGDLSVSVDQLNVGSYDNGSGGNANGKILRVKIKKTIGGSASVDFNPASYSASTSQTSWTSSTGEVWTINKSSGNTFVGVLVDKTMIQGNNTTTSMTASLSSTQPFTEYLVSTRNGTGNFIAMATGNTRAHSGTNLSLANGATLNYADTTTTRSTKTYRSNGANSGIALNNGTETTGNAGANNSTDLTIGQGAHNILTYVKCLANDSTAQRLAMYNFLRQINYY